MLPAIVIPVHKPQLSEVEAASLRQVTKVLNAFPIILVAPQSLPLHAYRSISQSVVAVTFDDLWFQSFRQHQKLMISERFYARFESFTHLLVYHLDSWVFRDELLHWCSKPYDYIGAPWRSGFDASGRPLFQSAGNGGFSLRRVEAFLKTLSLFDHRRYRTPAELMRELATRTGMSRLKHLVSLPLKLAGVGNNLRRFYQSYPYTEDKFWAHSAITANAMFRVAPVEVSSRFAFEASPEFFWKSLGKTLPFGCHAWRYEQAFWCDTIGLPADRDFRPHNEDGIAV